MQKVDQFIASGILELYCLGALSNREQEEVQQMIALHPAINEELQKVEETLHAKATSENLIPPGNLRNKILLGIEAAELGLPPLLSQVSSVNDWLEYLDKNNVGPKPGSQDLLWVDLPSSDNITSYAVWAPKGVAVEEEHADEEERLLMLKGRCKITANGITTFYNEGELVHIPAGTLHKAEAASEGLMVLIGQRVKNVSR